MHRIRPFCLNATFRRGFLCDDVCNKIFVYATFQKSLSNCVCLRATSICIFRTTAKNPYRISTCHQSKGTPHISLTFYPSCVSRIYFACSRTSIRAFSSENCCFPGNTGKNLKSTRLSETWLEAVNYS